MQSNRQIRTANVRQEGSAERPPRLRRRPLVANSAIAFEGRGAWMRAILGGLVLVVGLLLMVCWRLSEFTAGGSQAVIVVASLAMLMGLSMMGPMFGLNVFAGMSAAIESLSGGDSASVAGDDE